MLMPPVIPKLTDKVFMHYLAECISLTFLLFAAISYPYEVFAADTSSTQIKQSSANETITGAFGIKFGEDINPYLEGHYSGSSFDKQGYSFRYMLLNPPINIKEMFPDAHTLEVSGITDESNHVIVINLKTLSRTLSYSSSCFKSISAKPVMEFLREKYKMTPKSRDGFEEYVDNEGNMVEATCSGNSFNVTYTSHFLSDYITRIKDEQKKESDKFKESLKKVL